MRRLFEYQCKSCKEIFEELVPEESKTVEQPCPRCSGKGKFIISRPYFKEDIMSDRWLKNRHSHMKKEKKNMENHGTYD